MHIAIMGGTFNPIHYGHLRAAEEVRECLAIDRIIFVPAFLPPHKEDDLLTTSEDRFEMVRLAIKDNPNFEVSDIEIKRGGKSYSIDTVLLLQNEMPSAEISFIVGTDSFNDITTWHEYERLLETINLVVVARHGYPAKKIGEVLPERVARQFECDAEKNRYMHKDGKTITYIATTVMDISASDIRRRVNDGMSVKYLLPPAIERYIMGKGLYR